MTVDEDKRAATAVVGCLVMLGLVFAVAVLWVVAVESVLYLFDLLRFR